MAKELSKPTLTKAQAMKLCEDIRAGMGSIAEKLYELHQNCGWTVLGYLTWKDCCEKEFKHSAWWAKNQLRIAEVRKALPPLPPKQGTECVGTPIQSPTQRNQLSDAALVELSKVPEHERETVLDAAKTSGKPPTAAAIRKAAATVSKPDYGKCPNCAGTKWTEDAEGVTCSKCSHPHGEPAGDVDEDRIKIQRSKTVKTVEALMRAFDDLHTMLAKPEHGKVIETCKGLLKIARTWK